MSKNKALHIADLKSYEQCFIIISVNIRTLEGDLDVEDDLHDVYIIDKNIFNETYTICENL